MPFGRFDAINVAMGNTRASPYSFCVDAHAGWDADIVTWDMVRLFSFLFLIIFLRTP